MSIELEQFFNIKRKVEASPYKKKSITVPRGATLSYIRYRILRPFYKWQYKQYEKANPTTPWISPDATYILKEVLSKNFTGLEYGSGRSTVFLAQRVGKLFSVEHNEEWYNHVRALLKEKGTTNSDLRLIRPEKDVPHFHSSSERQVFITKEEYPNKDSLFRSYANYIDKFDDHFFDFVLVDGRARESCSLKAIEKLKPGGLLILDNSERVRYNKVHERLQSWPRIFTTTGLTDTIIWRKPD